MRHKERNQPDHHNAHAGSNATLLIILVSLSLSSSHEKSRFPIKPLAEKEKKNEEAKRYTQQRRGGYIPRHLRSVARARVYIFLSVN